MMKQEDRELEYLASYFRMGAANSHTRSLYQGLLQRYGSELKGVLPVDLSCLIENQCDALAVEHYLRFRNPRNELTIKMKCVFALMEYQKIEEKNPFMFESGWLSWVLVSFRAVMGVPFRLFKGWYEVRKHHV